MKQMLMMMLAFSLAINVDAQTKVRGRSGPSTNRVIIAAPIYQPFGFGYGYGSRFSPFFSSFYDPFFDPFNRGRYDAFNRTRGLQQEANELQLEMEEIENDYSFKISNARNDKSVSGKERRQKIRALKYEHEGALINARRNFLQKEKTVNNN